MGVNDLTVGVNEEYNAYDFVNTCTDLSMPCIVSFKDANDGDLSSKVGNYKIEIIISDNANNKVNKTVKLTVKEGYSFKEIKEKDFNVDHTSNDKSNWNNTYTIKFEKALEEESTEFNELLESYGIKEFSYDKNIKEKEIIVIYNKCQIKNTESSAIYGKQPLIRVVKSALLLTGLPPATFKRTQYNL